MWAIIVGDTDDDEQVEVMVVNSQSGQGVIMAESDELFGRLVALGDELMQRSGRY